MPGSVDAHRQGIHYFSKNPTEAAGEVSAVMTRNNMINRKVRHTTSIKEKEIRLITSVRKEFLTTVSGEKLANVFEIILFLIVVSSSDNQYTSIINMTLSYVCYLRVSGTDKYNSSYTPMRELTCKRIQMDSRWKFCCLTGNCQKKKKEVILSTRSD